MIPAACPVRPSPTHISARVRANLPILSVDRCYTHRMGNNSLIEAFWRVYCATRADEHACLREPHDAWPFGDNTRMADDLGGLVLGGVKAATAGLVWEDEYFGWKTPTVGDKTIILDGEGRPLCIIETTDVAVCPFDEVDDAFARQEGEGFADAADWRRAHWRYFARRCAEIGREPSERMPVVCQRFRVIYPR